MPDKEKAPISEARKKANAKHDKENFQYITFKARKGARERIVQAAQSSGESTNGFIRGAVNKAVLETTGQPMEDETGGTEAIQAVASALGESLNGFHIHSCG